MLFEFLLAATLAVAIGGVVIAYDGSRDVFHPLIFIAPMFAFLYAWMPWQLLSTGGLSQFFYPEQLEHVQTLFLLSVLAFTGGCLFSSLRVKKRTPKAQQAPLSTDGLNRLVIGGAIVGAIGLMCWAITIINVGGFVNAYSSSYSGGWDDSGYVRDGSLLLLDGILLILSALSLGASRLWSSLLIAAFSLPWLSQALLMARRGPTFAFVLVALMGWYFNRQKRPALFTFAALGLVLGWLVLFLVTNRSAIYIGSNFDVSTEVGGIVQKADTGNEYIYGSGTVLASERRSHYFWMRRYLAQVLVRPIPSAIWPTKYEDFGVPELLVNAGTSEGIADVLGWQGAPGSAPGIAADLWVELWWLSVPAIALLGYGYGWTWAKAVTCAGPWTSQYVIVSALSIYFVMQTMEAVIFRTILLSIPCWLTWKWAQRSRTSESVLKTQRQKRVMPVVAVSPRLRAIRRRVNA